MIAAEMLTEVRADIVKASARLVITTDTKEAARLAGVLKRAAEELVFLLNQ